MENKPGITLEILSPEGEIFKNRVDEVTLPAASGEITILPGHTPLFSKLAEGEIAIKAGGETSYICVAGGFIEVTRDKATVLANYAVRSEEIEVRRAEEAKKKAEELLKSRKDTRDFTLAENELKRSILALKVAEKYKKRKIR